MELNKHHDLVTMLIVVLAPLIGCSLDTIVGFSGVEELSDSDGDEGSGLARTPGSDSGEQPELSDEALPDFSVVDENPNSARYREDVSPRDYLGQISAWYFGHST